MRTQLPIWWTCWWLGGTALTLIFLLVNVYRRRRLANEPEAIGLALPTLRENLLWAALVVLGGAGGMAIILPLLPGAHTARALTVAVIFGLGMLLGLVMLIKNVLAPTDAIRLDASQTIWDDPPDLDDPDDLDPMQISQKHLRIRTNSGGFGPVE
jgi:hypothetical protein